MKKAAAGILAVLTALCCSLPVGATAPVESGKEIMVNNWANATLVEGDGTGEEGNPANFYTEEGALFDAEIVDFDGGKGLQVTAGDGNESKGCFKVRISVDTADFSQKDTLCVRAQNLSDKEAYGLWVQFSSLTEIFFHSSYYEAVTLINKDGSPCEWDGFFWGTSPTMPPNFDGYFLVDLTKISSDANDDFSAYSSNVGEQVLLQFMIGDGEVMADGASVVIGDVTLIDYDDVVRPEEPEEPSDGGSDPQDASEAPDMDSSVPSGDQSQTSGDTGTAGDGLPLAAIVGIVVIAVVVVAGVAVFLVMMRKKK